MQGVFVFCHFFRIPVGSMGKPLTFPGFAIGRGLLVLGAASYGYISYLPKTPITLLRILAGALPPAPPPVFCKKLDQKLLSYNTTGTLCPGLTSSGRTRQSMAAISTPASFARRRASPKAGSVASLGEKAVTPSI